VRQVIRAAGEIFLTFGAIGLLVLAVTAALWFFVFPWASIHLPIDASGFGG
jgi:hypothetical protein